MIKEQIREIFLARGAALCGFANAEAFAGTPEGFSPTDLYPACKAAIVFAVPLPKGVAEVSPRIVYQRFNTQALQELDHIAYLAAVEVEQTVPGAVAVPIPADGPYEYWVPETKEGRGILSMKHAAVLAGLGALGKNTLLLNRRYGSLLSIGTVLTNLDLPSDPPAESLCTPSCHRCVDGCPVGAIHDGEVDQLLCREHAYAVNGRGFDVVNCNLCRVQCPHARG